MRSQIEPEEVLLDANVLSAEGDEMGGLEGSRVELPIRAKRLEIIGYFAILLFIVFLIRIYSLQTDHNQFFTSFIKKTSAKIQYLPALRGIIYDKNMDPLVSNVFIFDLSADYYLLPEDNAKKNEIYEKISSVINIDKEKLAKDVELEKYEFGTRPILIKSNLSDDEIIYLKSNIENLPGFFIQQNYARNYIAKEPFAHAIGYVGKVGKNDLINNDSLTFSDVVGKEGLEKSYDASLRGTNGFEEKLINSKGREIGDGIKQNPVNGDGIVLSIDSKLQDYAYSLLQDVVENKHLGSGGSIVAIDPKTGNILTMVNYPSFDANIFSFSSDPKKYEEIFSDKRTPLFNRAIAGQYPSGSIIKPFIAVAALEENLINPNKLIDDTRGEIVIKNPYDAAVTYRFPDWKAHGFVDMRKAIAESCDVYFYTIGGGYGDVEGLGIERIKKYLTSFGFGGELNFDIMGENSGLVPDMKWKEETKNEQWFIGDTYHVSIGQGDLLVTPLQIANAITAIANEGTLFSPKLVSKIIKNDGTSVDIAPEILNRDFFSKDNIKIIKEGMRQTVTAGSARSLNNLSFKVAGKTGTAQFANNQKTHAWFVAFAPFDDPQIALAVLVDGGGEGSSTAVPIARDYLKEFFGVRE